MVQVLELPITARDVEREHRSQVKRWKKKHGELSYNGAPRMHGAQVIMGAEPHSRQDLRQKPTIIVHYPSVPELHPELSRSKKRGTLRKNAAPVPDIPNPYALPNDHKPSEQVAPAQPSAPAPAPPKLTASQETSPPLQQPLLTNLQEPIKEAPPSAQVSKQSPNSSVQQSSSESAPNASVSEPANTSPQPSHLLPPPSPSQPPPPAVPPPPAPPVEEPLQNWRPHLQNCPPVQPPALVSIPEDSAAPKVLENSPPTTASVPLLTSNASANENSNASHENGELRNSTESINSSEDTYL